VFTNFRDRNWLPLSECTIVPVGSRSRTALRNADTANDAVILESIE
jgi:hypothetical protein